MRSAKPAVNVPVGFANNVEIFLQIEFYGITRAFEITMIIVNGFLFRCKVADNNPDKIACVAQFYSLFGSKKT